MLPKKCDFSTSCHQYAQRRIDSDEVAWRGKWKPHEAPEIHEERGDRPRLATPCMKRQGSLSFPGRMIPILFSRTGINTGKGCFCVGEPQVGVLESAE